MVSLKELTRTVQVLLKIDVDIAAATQKLKEAKEKSRVLREETIPGAMLELGIESITLETGQKVTIKQEVYAAIPAANKMQAFQWLNDHGYGGLIKTAVITAFGKGERETAVQLAVAMRSDGLDSSFIETIHPQTLKAWLKEQIRNGKAVPMDLFGARPVLTTYIK